MISHSIERKTTVLKRTLLISSIAFNLNLIGGDATKPSEVKSYAYLKQAALAYETPVLKRSTSPMLSPWHVSSANPSEFLAVPVLCPKTGFFIIKIEQ